MINTILLFPIIAGALMFLFRRKWFDSFMLNLYAILHFVITLFLTFQTDAKSTIIPYFAVDNTNKIFLLVLSFVFLMTVIFNNGYAKHLPFDEKRLRRYSFMVLIFVFAMTGTVLSTDLGIAWVFVEATTLSSAYLIYFNKTKHAIEAAWKYVFICSIGIALAFVGLILLNLASGETNSLNYAVLYKNAVNFDPFWLKLAFAFMVFGFGVKMGLAPGHFWLPDAHSEAPSPISALLSATLLNSAFLVIVRAFKIMDIAGIDSYARLILLIMGFISLFITAVFVYHIKNYKRMLAYSSIENMGILIIGTALGGIGMFAAIVHLIGHSLIKASFFLTSGNILCIYETKKIKKINGLLNTDKKTGWLWILSFLGITAFPPSVLFISEFLMIKSMFLQKHYVSAILFVLLLTIVLFGLTKALIGMCYGDVVGDKADELRLKAKKLPFAMYLPQIVLLLIAFSSGIYIPLKFGELIQLSIFGL